MVGKTSYRVFISVITAKGNWKRKWKRHEALIDSLFMKIMENRRKGR